MLTPATLMLQEMISIDAAPGSRENTDDQGITFSNCDRSLAKALHAWHTCFAPLFALLQPMQQAKPRSIETYLLIAIAGPVQPPKAQIAGPHASLSMSAKHLQAVKQQAGGNSQQSNAAVPEAETADDASAQSSAQSLDKVTAPADSGIASAETLKLPVADMAALAQRIGASAAAAQPRPSIQHSHAVADGTAATVTPAVAGAPVPAEIEGIIQKLVSFIKVGLSGRADCNMNGTQCGTMQALLGF